MSIKVRFAPSPTGLLHLGNMYIATINWLFAKKNNGTFILRCDDTDLERSKEEFEENIKNDLIWIGLNWDYYFKQSSNLLAYSRIKDQLIDSGKLYPCYESQEELDLQRKIQLNQKKMPVYNRAALKLSNLQKQNLESQGIKPYWRLKLDDEVVVWNDLSRGTIKYDSSNVSDPVLIRSDNFPLYTLTSVVDDINYDISHIIRGEDHITNTVAQIQLFKFLGAKVPEFAHLPMLIEPSGKPLSKRDLSNNISYFKDNNLENLTLINLFTCNSIYGTSPACANLEQIIENFSLEKLGRSSICIDIQTVFDLNRKILSKMSFNQVKSRLELLNIFNGEQFWNIICYNINNFYDVLKWQDVINGQAQVVYFDKNITNLALDVLPYNFENDNFSIWIDKIKNASGLKNKDLYKILYLAFTGQEYGPNLEDMIKLMTKSTIVKYLQG